jgi:hypothetical protein
MADTGSLLQSKKRSETTAVAFPWAKAEQAQGASLSIDGLALGFNAVKKG